MANTAVANMTAASAFDGTELLYVVQGGADRKGTTAQAKTFANSGPVVQSIRVVTASGDVTSLSTDGVIFVNKTVGAATVVNLYASPSSGATMVIKDGKGDAGTNNITLTPNAGNIDGSSTFVIGTNYQSATIVYNGTQWNVI